MRKSVLTLNDDAALGKIGESLSSPIRRKILNMVCIRSYSLVELAEELNFAFSTISFHLKILREAGLIKSIASPSKKGNEKNISIDCDNLLIYFNGAIETPNLLTVTDIPLGSFIDFDIAAPCSICTNDKSLEPLDDINMFYSPERINAQLVAFYKGYIVYPFPVNGDSLTDVSSVSVAIELCSECPNHNNTWKSHITFWINDVEIVTYLSKGDYGDRRGRNTPDWWPNNSTQYGIPITIAVNNSGTYINGEHVSDIKIGDLNVQKNKINRLKIGVKEDSKYVGGINIFGSNFGDTDDNIIVTVAYENKQTKF